MRERNSCPISSRFRSQSVPRLYNPAVAPNTTATVAENWPDLPPETEVAKIGAEIAASPPRRHHVRKLHSNLASVLKPAALADIENEISVNVVQLYALGRQHFLFAKRQQNKDWRQKVSRFYYGAYNVSRAIRLCVYGEYTIDSSDHKKIENLPDDFPNKNTYTNKLGVLREDRNLCDYDHAAARSDLVYDIDDSCDTVERFLQDAKKYLRKRGVNL